MSTAFLQVDADESIQVVQLKLPNSLQSDEFDEINRAVEGLLAENRAKGWIFDLTGVDYMASATLGLMVNIRQQIKQSQGRLVLCGMSPRLQSIFHTCSLERLFQIAKTQEDARRALGRKAN